MSVYRVGDLVKWKGDEGSDDIGLILEIRSESDPPVTKALALWSGDDRPKWYPARALVPVQPADPCDIT